ncbi:hypothetical protein [Roseovarius sp. TM1035]|uniref:hypothetical protein n=1 Tax=Roseovarius sp. TM1035 TaxID=391613 RepID=UPI0005646BBB|nr:hypothetical protein [Roseovarius sp. TM1035]
MADSISYEFSSLSIKNAEFVTQTGVLKAGDIKVSFARYSPSSGGFSVDDTVLNRTLDTVRLAPVWRMVCNQEITLRTQQECDEVYLRPGYKRFCVNLSDEIVLKSFAKGITFISRGALGNLHRVALEIALGGPTKVFAKQSRYDLSIFLNEWRSETIYRSFFDSSKGGVFNEELQASGLKEVFQKAVSYQERQSDKGENFRFAVKAFIDARSACASYTIQMLAALQFLEWLDGETTMKPHKMAEKFGIPPKAAKAILILRNEFFHNPKQKASNVNLLLSVEKAGEAFEACGIDIQGLGGGSRNSAVLNYVVSLAGYLLMREIGADVVPTFFIPGHGEYTP